MLITYTAAHANLTLTLLLIYCHACITVVCLAARRSRITHKTTISSDFDWFRMNANDSLTHIIQEGRSEGYILNTKLPTFELYVACHLHGESHQGRIFGTTRRVLICFANREWKQLDCGDVCSWRNKILCFRFGYVGTMEIFGEIAISFSPFHLFNMSFFLSIPPSRSLILSFSLLLVPKWGRHGCVQER